MLENVRSFQGFANCYSYFIPKICGGSNPINVVDNKDVEIRGVPRAKIPRTQKAKNVYLR